MNEIKPINLCINGISKTLPLAFDESITMVELLYAIKEKLNESINNTNIVSDEMKNLYDYVNNYFENLDVQEEINNKLDEMAESGQLTEIIAEYLNLASILVYSTVNDMIASENLDNGSTVKTLGFYNLNDGGGATYKIRTIDVGDNPDEKMLITISESLVAELIKEDSINIKQLGAYGDGTNDDTETIQTALDNFKNVVISDGTYLISTSGIKPSSNSKISLINATLQMETNALDSYQIIDLDNVSNVIIEGGILIGDKDTHTGAETGQAGHCIKLSNNATNITLKNIKITKGFGDGIYVGASTDVLCDGVIVDDNRRNGISVINTNGFKIINSTISNTSGTDPQSGIDIEPNSGDEIKNVSIINCKIFGNTEDGIHTANRYPNDYPNAINGVNISNNFIYSNKIGIRPSYVKKLTISNNIFTGNTQGAINTYIVDNALISNNLISGNGYNMNLYNSNYNEITGNICENATSSSSHSVNFQGCEYNIFTNNIVRNNKLSGVNLTSISSSNISQYNLINNNKIYDNSKEADGSYNNISLSNYCSHNIIKDNDFIGTNNNAKYNIYSGSTNSGSTNMFIGNIMVSQTDGAIYARSNATLDNIIDGALVGGTLRT